MADITNDRSRIIYNNEGQAIFGGSNAVIWVNPAAGSHAGVNFRQDGTFKGFVGFNNSSSCVNLSRDGSIADGINVDASHNVGIGVTSMGHKLDVSGNIRLQGGDRKIVFNNGSVETSLDQMAGGVGGLGTLGRFGVGTVAPNNILQVVGNITIGTGTTNEAIRTIMTGGTLVLQATDQNHRIIIRGTQSTDGTITGNSNNMDFYEYGGYNFYSGVNVGTGARNLALTINNNGIAGFGSTGIYAGTNAALNLPSYALAIKNNVSGSDNNWSYIRNTGTGSEANIEFTTGIGVAMTMAHNKNIGIGVTSPSDLLSLATTSGDCVIGLTGNSGGDPEIHMDSGNNRSGNIKYGDGSTLAMFRYQHSDVAFKFYAHNQTDVDFQIGENTSFFASCDVGIGTTSPDARLHIEGDSSDQKVLEISTAQSDGPYTAYKNRSSGTTTLGFIGNSQGIMNSGTTNFGIRANNDLTFSSGGASERMRITSAGHIGIGTTSPSTGFSGSASGVLELAGTKPAIQVTETDVSNSYIYMGSSGGSAYIGMLGAKLHFQTGTTTNANRMTIDASGNVGIGQTNMGHKLDVNGDAKFISNSSSRVLTLLQQSTNNGNIIQFQNQSGSNVWELVGRNNQFYIYNNALTAHALFIDPSNSNIGIGNTSPSQKLHVTGSILASSDVVAFSDKKLKENIKTLDGSKVYDMRGVSFTRKDTGKDSSGVIAQEIQKIAPELVTDNDGTLSVAYGNLTGYLIEAVKELKTEVEQLKKQIKNGNNV